MTTNRFYIAKDLVEWAKDLPEAPWGNLADSDETKWQFQYNGDPDLKKFIHIYDKDIALFQKFFPNMDIWLKNIFWEDIFASSAKILENFCKNINENTLAIMHMSPLEMAIVGETLSELGLKNIVYNFNRAAAVNSKSKTLEATLFIVAWRETPWLQEKITKIAEKTKQYFHEKNTKNIIVFLDENDIPPIWNISHIDEYIKGAIGWKENTVTYKIDDLPNRDFLLEKNIKNIYFFDQDTSSKIDDFYEKRMNDIFKIKKFAIDASVSDKIGYYENYVVSKNEEYIEYRKNILQKAEKTAGKISFAGGGGLEKTNVANDFSNIFKNKTNEKTFTKWESILAGISLITFFLIFIALVVGSNTYNGSSGSGSTSSSTTSGFRFGGGSNWGGSFSSPSSSSSSSSSSSISSFGGGGFSKSSSGG